MESRLVRFLRELMVPAILVFVMATVWCVGWSRRLADQARHHRLPSPAAMDAYRSIPPVDDGRVDADLTDLPQ